MDIQQAVEIYKQTNDERDLKVILNLMNKYTYQEVMRREDELEARSDLNYMIYHSIEHYDTSKSIKFITFFWHCYHNHVNKQWRANQTYKRGVGIIKMSMNKQANDEGDEYAMFIPSKSNDLQKRLFQVDVNHLLSKIKDRKDAAIIRFIYEGYSQKEIAVMLKTSRNAVNQRVKRLDQKAYMKELYSLMKAYIAEQTG